LQTSVLLNTGGPIEKHARKIYTPVVYTNFGAQIFLSRSYAVEEIIHGSRFMTIHFDAEKRRRWSQIALEVCIDQENDTFQCDCRMYEHIGDALLSCHQGIDLALYFSLFSSTISKCESHKKLLYLLISIASFYDLILCLIMVRCRFYHILTEGK
jgi:hypothetical protein